MGLQRAPVDDHRDRGRGRHRRDALNAFSRYDYDFALAILLSIVAHRAWSASGERTGRAGGCAERGERYRRGLAAAHAARVARATGRPAGAAAFADGVVLARSTSSGSTSPTRRARSADLMRPHVAARAGRTVRAGRGPAAETINIATLGTAIAVVLSLPVAFLAALNTTLNRATYAAARVVMVASRSVDT